MPVRDCIISMNNTQIVLRNAVMHPKPLSVASWPVASTDGEKIRPYVVAAVQDRQKWHD